MNWRRICILIAMASLLTFSSGCVAILEAALDSDDDDYHSASCTCSSCSSGHSHHHNSRPKSTYGKHPLTK